MVVIVGLVVMNLLGALSASRAYYLPTTYLTNTSAPPDGVLLHNDTTDACRVCDANDSSPCGCCCASWKVPMDEWWLHRPHWEFMALRETNETHQCFRPSTHPFADFLQQVHAVQFNTSQNCSSDVYYHPLALGGLGATLGFLAKAFAKTYLGGAAFGIAKHWDGAVWNFAGLPNGTQLTCPAADFSCYFLPVTPCNNTTTTVLPGGLRRLGQFPPQAPPQPPRFLLPDQQPYLKAYMTRPQQWLRRKMYEYLHDRVVHREALLASSSSSSSSSSDTPHGSRRSRTHHPTPTACLHVRRTDVLLERRKGDKRMYFPLEAYVQAALAHHQQQQRQPHTRSLHNNNNNNHTVLVLFTDDQTTMDELPLFSNITFVYVNKTRFRGTQGGFAGHLPTGQPAEELTAMLVELHLASHYCSTLVHTHSGYATTLLERMRMNHHHHHNRPTHNNHNHTTTSSSNNDDDDDEDDVVDIAIDQLYQGPRIQEDAFLAGLKDRLQAVSVGPPSPQAYYPKQHSY